MSERFTARALRLGGLATRALGWRPAEFWGATPAELAMAMSGGEEADTPPTHEQIRRMIERDRNDG
ncbi:MAG: phage tail assembly chaperone [Qipengyuania sp.]